MFGSCLIRLLCREPGALSKGLKALGKGFAKSLPRGSRQRALGKDFAEGQNRPRQNLRRRPGTSMVTSSLPRASLAGSQQRLFIFFKKSFVESLPGWLSAKNFF